MIILYEQLHELISSRMGSASIFCDFNSRNSSGVINRRCEWNGYDHFYPFSVTKNRNVVEMSNRNVSIGRYCRKLTE